MVRGLLTSPTALGRASHTTGERAVYFDVLGAVLIAYPASTGTALNLAFGIASVSLAASAARRAPPGAAAATWRLLCRRTALGMGAPLLLGAGLTLSGASMAWSVQCSNRLLDFLWGFLWQLERRPSFVRVL